MNMHRYKMKSYCLKCRKNTKNINPKVSKTSNGRTMLLSKCAISNKKKIKIYQKSRSKRTNQQFSY